MMIFWLWFKSLFIPKKLADVIPIRPIETVSPVTLGSATPWMDWMKYHIGEHEVAGKKDNPFIMSLYKYANYPTEHDEVPWCAVAVCAALELNGYKDSNSAAAKSYDTYGTACELKPGCIVALRHPNGGRHVGFCFSVISDRWFVMLGGNQQNSINKTMYNRSEIVATMWPVKA